MMEKIFLFFKDRDAIVLAILAVILSITSASAELKVDITRGTVKALPYFSNNQYCPVKSIKKWLEISKIDSGSLFRRFSKGSKLTEHRLTDQTVALLIKEYLESNLS